MTQESDQRKRKRHPFGVKEYLRRKREKYHLRGGARTRDGAYCQSRRKRNRTVQHPSLVLRKLHRFRLRFHSTSRTSGIDNFIDTRKHAVAPPLRSDVSPLCVAANPPHLTKLPIPSLEPASPLLRAHFFFRPLWMARHKQRRKTFSRSRANGKAECRLPAIRLVWKSISGGEGPRVGIPILQHAYI